MRIEHINEEDPETKEQKLGYKILFEFSPNDFFENRILEKTYLYGQEVDYTGELVYDHATGTTIQWKEDKDLTKEFEIKKQRNKSVFSKLLSLPIVLTFFCQTPTVLASFVKLAQ